MKKQKHYEEQFSTLTFFYDIWHFAMYGNEPPKPLTHEEQLARIQQLYEIADETSKHFGFDKQNNFTIPREFVEELEKEVLENPENNEFTDCAPPDPASEKYADDALCEKCWSLCRELGKKYPLFLHTRFDAMFSMFSKGTLKKRFMPIFKFAHLHIPRYNSLLYRLVPPLRLETPNYRTSYQGFCRMVHGFFTPEEMEQIRNFRREGEEVFIDNWKEADRVWARMKEEGAE